MKKLLFTLLLLTALFNSCVTIDTVVYGCTDPQSTTYNPAATDNDGSCKYEGNVTFWYNSNGTNATVTINNQTAYVTKYYNGYDPNCGAEGCANFTLPIGTYAYKAESTWSTWTGTVTVGINKCSMVLLK